MDQAIEATMETTLFPISMEKHIIFAVVAAVFFILQFIRTKQWYQLVMAAAIPLSLLIYIDPESSVLFYGVGITEGVLLCAALVLNIVQSHKQNKADQAAAEAAKAAEAEQPAAETAVAERAEAAAEEAAPAEAPAEDAE